MRAGGIAAEPSCISKTALAQLNAEIDDFIKVHKQVDPLAFSIKAKAYFETQKWNVSKFIMKTNLNRNIYYRITNNKPWMPSIHTALTICVALGLTSREIMDMLLLAGYDLTKSDNTEEIVFLFLLARFAGHPIEAWNDVLGSRGMPLLGGKISGYAT